MRLAFDTEAVKGELFVETAEKALEDEDANAALMLVCAFSRRISLRQVSVCIRHMLTAECVGPLVHPSAWTSNAYKLHSAHIDVMRRFEDFRRALIELDEVSGRNPHALESTD